MEVVAAEAAEVGALWAAQVWCIRRKIEAEPGWRDREVNMGKQCIHKEADGQQCPLTAEKGLFCEKHSGSKAKSRLGGGGGGGSGLGGKIGESLLPRSGVVYHHAPPDKKKDYLD